MRVAITALAVLLAAAALAAATTDSYLVETKVDVPGGTPMYVGRDIGDSIATPFGIEHAALEPVDIPSGFPPWDVPPSLV